MIALFQAYFHMTIAACLVILVTLAVRPVFKKFSNRIACLLWAVVLLRLLCPVALKIPSLPQRANPVIEAEFSSQSIETSGDLFKDNTSESEYVSGSQTAKEYLQTVHVSTIAQDRQAAKASEHINVSKPGETGGDLLKENTAIASGKVSELTTEATEKISETTEAVTEKTALDATKSATETATKTEAPFLKALATRLSAAEQGILGTTLGIGILVTCGILWLTGMMIFQILGAAKYLRLKRQLAEALPLMKWDGYPVKTSDVSGVPMSFGIFRRTIYVPASFRDDANCGKTGRKSGRKSYSELDKEYGAEGNSQAAQRRMILTHEAIHLRHMDPLWKVLAFLALSVHWWNPLVWLSVYLLNRDIELACDETVLKKLGCAHKKEYAETLLDFAENNSKISLVAAFGESHAETRIKNVIRYKRIPAWLSAALFAGALTLGGCLATASSQSAEQDKIMDGSTISEYEILKSESAQKSGNENVQNAIDANETEENLTESLIHPVTIDENSFPDPVFRQYISDRFDEDQNGSLSKEEILEVTEIWCDEMEITSMKGVEFFPELEMLSCLHTQVSELDVCRNTKLRYLDCGDTKISTLDIGSCPQLRRTLAMGGHSRYGTTEGPQYGSFSEFTDSKLYPDTEICDVIDYMLRVNEETVIYPEYDFNTMDISFMFSDIRGERWKEIYADLLENWLIDDDDMRPEVGLVYLNEDEIPELVVDGPITKVFTIADGKVCQLNTLLYNGFDYKEKANILLDNEMHMGYAKDAAWQIKDGRFVCLHEGDYSYHSDEKNDFVMDQKEVSEQEYEAVLENLIKKEDRVCCFAISTVEDMLKFLKGEMADDYKQAYAELIQNGAYYKDVHSFEWSFYPDQYQGFALIERDGASPLLICANDNDDQYRIISYEDGLLCTGYYKAHVGIYQSYELYVYPHLGLIEVVDFLGEDQAQEEFDSVLIDRTMFKDGVELSWDMSTNDENVLDLKGSSYRIKRNGEPLEYRINGVYVSKEEFVDFNAEINGAQKILITPYGAENAQITYLTAKELLEELSK